MIGGNFRKKKKLGLVLSGGGVKAAAFHIGVCLALKEKGFRFSGGPRDLVKQRFSDDDPLVFKVYVGSSAGSFVASILAAGYDLESLINAFQLGSGQKPSYKKNEMGYLKPISYRDLFHISKRRILKFLPDTILRKGIISGGIEALVKNGIKLNGIFTAHGLEKYLRQEAFVNNEFSDLGAELYVIATQLNHTRKAIFGPFKESYKTESSKYINYATISDAVAASISLPPVYAPYEIPRPDGKKIYYYDGEIRETLSSHVAADHGCDLIISSYSVQPYHFNETIGSLHQFGIPVILNQALYQVIQQKITKHIEWQSTLKSIYKALDLFARENKLSEQSRSELLEIVKSRTSFRPDVDYLYIHPRPENHEMFFVDHFSLNTKILEKIVSIGFKSALNVLRRYDF